MFYDVLFLIFSQWEINLRNLQSGDTVYFCLGFPEAHPTERLHSSFPVRSVTKHGRRRASTSISSGVTTFRGMMLGIADSFFFVVGTPLGLGNLDV